jgi:hypothetical protein
VTRWLLNSAVLPAGAYGIYRYTAATVEELRAYVGQPYVSRIGYPETAEVIERWTGVRPALSHETSPLAVGDTAMVVRLRHRVDPRDKGRRLALGDEAWEVSRLERVDARDEQTAVLRRLLKGASPRGGASPGQVLPRGRGAAPSSPQRGRASSVTRHIRNDYDLDVAQRDLYRLREGATPRTREWIDQWVVVRPTQGDPPPWAAWWGLGSATERIYQGTCPTRDEALVWAVRAWREATDGDLPRVLELPAEGLSAWDAVDAGTHEVSAAEVRRVLETLTDPPPPMTSRDKRRAAKGLPPIGRSRDRRGR